MTRAKKERKAKEVTTNSLLELQTIVLENREILCKFKEVFTDLYSRIDTLESKIDVFFKKKTLNSEHNL